MSGELPTVGSVWRHGDEWRSVRYLYDDADNTVEFRTFGTPIDFMASSHEWSRWVASGAVQVYPPPAVPQGSGETVRFRGIHSIDSDGSQVLVAITGSYFENFDRRDLIGEAMDQHISGAAKITELDIVLSQLPTVPVVSASVEGTVQP